MIHTTFIDKVNNAMEYIEANLTGDIDYGQAARQACCSEYYFLRMFSYMSNIPLSEYIRRRKLTLAAFDMCCGAKVINVSSKYGYSSPEAFSRAFKQLHGISPIAARNGNCDLKAYPKLTFNVSLGGEDEISYRIVSKQAHTVCGIATDIPWVSGNANSVITSFWGDSTMNDTIGRFHRDIGLSYDVCLNAALYNFRQSAFSYMICYETAPESAPKEYTALSVPPLTWAVFRTPKHQSRQTTEQVRTLRDRIFKEWFPTSGYLLASGPQFEMLTNDGGTFVIDVWIPINCKHSV